MEAAASGTQTRHAEPGPDERPASTLETVELALTGMHCNACATRIERALAAEPSVASASVNLATQRAFVAYQPGADGSDALCATVQRIGYGAAPVTPDAPVATRADPDHWTARAALSWPLAVAALLVALIGPEDALAGWTVLVLGLLVEVVGAWPFLRTAARLLRHGATSMDTLIALGTLAALAVSAVEAIALGGKHLHLGGSGAFAARLHGSMAPLIVSILATGRAIEARARARAARALHALMSLRPPTARVVADPDDEEGTLVPPESVPVGALIRVRPAEAVPLDGTVVRGWSALDESMLTGEPMPVERGPGSVVTGGTRNGSGALVVRVSAPAGETVLARMQRLVEKAQQDKPPLQRLADRISAVFVPVVLLGALATFLAWWLGDGNLGTAVLSGVAVLLVACPCAMGLAAPVAMMVGCGRASALGILLRNGDTLERLARADTVALDKTGTLTERTAVVAGVAPAPGHSAAQVLSLAAAVERENDHPLALAICAAAGAVPRADGVAMLPGAGVRGTVDGEEVAVGIPGTSLPPGLADELAAHERRGETVVAVRRGGAVIGLVAVSTPLKPEARAAVAGLRAMGLETIVLSGDSVEAVGTVAGALGIDRAEGRLSPEEKLDALRELQDARHRVIMVGDGVNDAPALAVADVGCAIGSGAEAALESSDVALLGNDLLGVPAAIAVARSTSSVILQNFGWAMGYNVSALPLAAAGLLDPLVAAVAMGLSSLIVVLNSLRLTRLGRRGLDQMRPPRVARGARGFVLGVAIPMLLFAGSTAAAQAFSPARGQSLLPTLPDITVVPLPHGDSAQVYLEPGRAGVNQLHIIVTGPSGPSGSPLTGPPAVRAARQGTAGSALRLARLSAGHYFSVTVLGPGSWRFSVVAHTSTGTDRFSVERTVNP
jgi:heavy metal translocating P-type ATPase